MTPASTASTTLLKQFGLTTAAEDLVPRLTQAGHHDALPVLLEVLEAEAEARRQRRIARLQRAARLPPGKTFATLDTGRLPDSVVQQLKTLATGAFPRDGDQCAGLRSAGRRQEPRASTRSSIGTPTCICTCSRARGRPRGRRPGARWSPRWCRRSRGVWSAATSP